MEKTASTVEGMWDTFTVGRKFCFDVFALGQDIFYDLGKLVFAHWAERYADQAEMFEQVASMNREALLGMKKLADQGYSLLGAEGKGSSQPSLPKKSSSASGRKAPQSKSSTQAGEKKTGAKKRSAGAKDVKSEDTVVPLAKA